MKLYVEAKDNVKFLTTLERHFKNISRGSLGYVLNGSFQSIWSLGIVDAYCLEH